MIDDDEEEILETLATLGILFAVIFTLWFIRLLF